MVTSLLRRILHRRSYRYIAINSDENVETPPGNRNLRARSPNWLTVSTQLSDSHTQTASPSTLDQQFSLCPPLYIALWPSHVSSFQNLWFIFLSTPRFDPHKPIPPLASYSNRSHSILPGGLGMASFICRLRNGPSSGTMGITLPLFLYPVLTHSDSAPFRSFRLKPPFSFPLAYFPRAVPSRRALARSGRRRRALHPRSFLARARTPLPPPLLPVILVQQTRARTRSILGTMHGVTQSVKAAHRARWRPLLTGMWGFGAGPRGGRWLVWRREDGWRERAGRPRGMGHEGDHGPKEEARGGMRRDQ